jgi:hypothetical protein
MCLQHDLREQGIDPCTVDRAAERPMAENFEALCDRQIDRPAMSQRSTNVLFGRTTR